jgi:hypothetical protein
VLKWGLAGSLFAPLPYAWVWAQQQSEGALKLVRVPKVALVIGNAKYPESPLKNPVNDARGIADELKALGFDVNLKLDAGRKDMIAAIQAFGADLVKKKGVGMFYYAGHGAQLAWKNYLIPVDAEIEKIEDMQAKTVELNSLLDALVKAQNPMNVIILDACRDNPFGTKVRSQQKGLSQFDAPPGSLLAYATSPGNTAADGEGANGLYTENLLREIKVPEARIEDVFKRVRLAVRRKTDGQQIPWESTSLEEDFWFIPPKEIKRLSEEEAQRLFQEELALWEKIKESKDPKPLEDYLRRYPSGKFTELAQLQLERALAAQGEKKIQVASSAGNPFTKGSTVANTAYKIGDTYTFRILDLKTRAEKRQNTQTVQRITDSEVIFDNGGSGLVTDLLGNVLKSGDGRRFTPRQQLPLEYAVGRQWHSRFLVYLPKGDAEGVVDLDLKIVARESITVPAGTFNAFRIEASGPAVFKDHVTESRITRWMAPDQVRRNVAYNEITIRDGKVVYGERFELVSFKQS